MTNLNTLSSHADCATAYKLIRSKYNIGKLTTTGNPKLDKAVKFGFLNTGITLLPHSMMDTIQGEAVRHNLCLNSTKECRENCLVFSGRGYMSNVMKARLNRSKAFINEPVTFWQAVVHRARLDLKIAKKYGLKLAFRFNILSDVQVPSWVIDAMANEGIRCYDYTKDWNRESSDKYHLTYSVSDKTRIRDMVDKLNSGKNVTIVFDGPVPSEYLGFKVVSGMDSDLRFLDPAGVIVGLEALGKLKRSNSRFKFPLVA